MNYLVIAIEQEYQEQEEFTFDHLDEAMKFIEENFTRYGEFKLYKSIDFNVKVTVEIG